MPVRVSPSLFNLQAGLLPTVCFCGRHPVLALNGPNNVRPTYPLLETNEYRFGNMPAPADSSAPHGPPQRLYGALTGALFSISFNSAIIRGLGGLFSGGGKIPSR